MALNCFPEDVGACITFKMIHNQSETVFNMKQEKRTREEKFTVFFFLFLSFNRFYTISLEPKKHLTIET